MQNSGGARAVVRHKCVPRTSPQSYAIMTDVQQPPGLRYVHHFSFNGSVYSWSFYSNELSRRYTTCDTCKRLNVLASRRAVNLESIVIFFFLFFVGIYIVLITCFWYFFFFFFFLVFTACRYFFTQSIKFESKIKMISERKKVDVKQRRKLKKVM